MSFKNVITLFAATSVLTCALSSARADVTLLGSSGDITASGGISGIYPTLSLNMGFLTSSFEGSEYDQLFQWVAIPNTATGTTYTATAGTDANFNAFVTQLTDGTSEYVGAADGVQDFLFQGKSEATFFTLPSGSNGIDFAGDTIDHISFLVNSVSIASPGSNPNGNGNWTDYSIHGVLQVYGETAAPEPTATLLLAGSAAMLLLRRRRSSAATI